MPTASDSTTQNEPLVHLPRRTFALKIALYYAVLGTSYLLSSHWILAQVEGYSLHHTLSGLFEWLLVALTAGWVGWVLDRYFGIIRHSGLLLKEAEERWRWALEGASQAAWDWNPQQDEVFYSLEWKALLGYQPEEIGNALAEWKTRVHPDDLPQVLEEVKRHLEGQTSFYISEHRLRRKDGSYMWVLDQGKVTARASDGTPLRVVGTHCDIHRRKQAEERSQLQHDLMQALAATNALEEGMKLCLEAAIKADGLTCGGFYLADLQSGLLRLKVYSGLSSEYAGAVALIEPESPQGLLVTVGTPLYLGHKQLQLHQSNVELREGLCSIAVIPVRCQGRLLGCLNVASRTHDEVPDSTRLALETIAASAGAAIARLQAQEALRESEEKFRGIFHESVAAIFVFDTDKRFLDANQAGLDLLGYSREELLRLRISDVDADPVVASPAHRQLMSGGRLINFEHRLLRKDGTVVTVLDSSRPLTDLQGNVQGMLSTLIDITERKRAEESLLRSEARYRALFDEAIEGIALLSTDGTKVAVNAAFARMHGYESPAEMESLQLSSLATPSSAPSAEERVFKAAAGEVLTYEVEHYRRDGSTCLLSATASRVDLGGTEYLQVFHRDITEQKRAQAELRRWADAFEHCAHGIALGIPGRNVVMTCNPAFARMLGRTVEEVTDTEIKNLYVPEDHARIRQHQAEADLKGLVRYESRMVRSDGTTFPVQMDVVSVRDAQRQLIYRVATVQDISERQAAGAALRQQLELQDQLAKVAATVPGLICSYRLRPDGSACMPFATAAIDDIYGLQPENVREDFSRAFSQVHPDDRKPLLESIAESARTLQPWNGLFRTRHPRKGEVWVEGHSVPKLEPDGSILWHGFVQDVTERKHLEQEREAALITYRTLFDTLPIGVTVTDPSGQLLESNRVAEQILGLNRTETRGLGIGAPDWNIVRPDGTPMMPEEFASVRALKGQHLVENIEMGLIKSPSETTWITVNAAPVPLPELGVVITYTDVSARKQAESLLRQNEERFHSLFEHMSSGVAVYEAVDHGQDFVFKNFNSAGERMEKVSRDHVIGRRVTDVFPSVKKVGLLEVLRRVYKTGSAEHHPISEYHDGPVSNWRECWVYKLPSGEVVAVSDDSTERKLAEEALRQSESLLRQMGQLARVGGWELEVATGKRKWTEEVASILGLPMNAQASRAIDSSSGHDPTHHEIEAALELAVSQATPYDLELELVTPAGTHKWIRTIGQPVLENGRVVKVRGAFQDITERKHAEEALQFERRRLASILHGANVGTWEWNVETGEAVFNERFAEMAGYSLAELAPISIETWYRLIHPDDLKVSRALVKRHFRGELDHYECEARLMHKNGSWIWVLGRGRVTSWTGEGRPLMMQGTHTDITQRKHAEEELALEATRRRILIEGSRDGIVVLDQEGGVFETNRRFAEMMGYTTDEVRLLHVWDWDRGWPRQRVIEAIRDLGPEGAHFETRHSRKDGSFLDVELSNSAAEFGGKRLVFCVCRDITERKRSEEALRHSEEQFRAMFEVASIGMAQANPKTGRFERVNKRMSQMTGFSESELLNLKIREITHPEDRELDTALFNSVVQGDMPSYRLQKRYIRKDGRIVWVNVNLTLIRDAEGQPLRTMATIEDITEQKRAIEALGEREEIFSSVVSQAADAIAIFDASKGSFAEFNAAAHQGLGYSREEFAEFGVGDIQAEHFVEDIWKNIEIVRTQGGVEFETRHRHRDGSQRDVMVRIQRLNIRNRDYMAAVWTDITEKKRAEALAERDAVRTRFLLELHQRAPQMGDEELYDHVLERAVTLTGSTNGFFHQVSDDQTSIFLTTWNRETLKNCTAAFAAHYPLAEAGNWVDCIRDRRPIIYNDFPNSPHQRGLPVGHVPVQRFMSIPVFHDGKVRIIFGVGNKQDNYDADDLTQLQLVANELHKLMLQRLAQKRLCESEERFRQLVETSCDWVWEVDAAGRYTYASPQVKNLLGYPPEEVLGKTPFDLMPEAERRRMEAFFQEIASRCEPFFELENINRHKDGREVILETNAAPILGPDGKLLGYRGMDRDISERRRMEARLRQAQKLEAIGQLAGGVAHDFNNILAAIMLHIGLMQLNPELDAETLQSLGELDAEAQRAAALTRQLLMLSRRSVLTVKPQDLNDLTANMLKMLTRLIGEDIRLSFEGASRLSAVEADAGMVEQVLMNLVVNARDAMPRGGRITLSTSQYDFTPADQSEMPERRPGRFACLAVSDTGCGMEAETLKRIFEPFFTTKEAGKGTGLGLATVHGIAAQHKGWVEVESVVGRGTTFRVFLPAVTAMPPSAEGKNASAPLQGGREAILLVEDDAGVRQTVGHALRLLGYQVFEAANGQDAISQWETLMPLLDLLMTDMVMPEGLTGLELAEKLRKQRPQLKVIISSGYSAEMVQDGAPNKVGITYLPKPYSTKTLAETIRRCLQKT